MKGNILISKIVANSTESGWSQAYSTLNLYIVIGLSAESPEKPIASIGKDVLERLQREFFVIDNKTLDTVKQAVQNVVDTLTNINYSIVLATIAKDTLYVITAGKGSAVIKRSEKVGVIADGEDEKVSAFSGPLKPGDIFVIETKAFSEKIPLDRISPLLSGPDLTSISEGIAPLVHDNPTGTEAAILIEYVTGEEVKEEEEVAGESIENAEQPPKISENPFPESKKGLSMPSLPKLKLSFPKLSFKFRKTYIIIALIVILIGAFFFLLQNEQNRKANVAQDKILNEVLADSKRKYDEGESLEDLNKNLALDSYAESRDILESGKDKLTDGSRQEKLLIENLSRVNEKIESLGGGTSGASEKKVFDKNVSLVTTKDGVVVIDDKGSLYILENNGEVSKTIETKVTNPISLTSDDKNVYILTSNSIYKVDRASGKTEKISSSTSDSNSIDNFIGNVYTLSPGSEDVLKYSGTDFTKSSYFPKTVSFSEKPVWFTIDGSVWIILEDGSIKKYTRGVEDTFQVKNLPKELGKKLEIYTSSDIDNVYILDISNARIVALSKNGDFQKAYALSKIPSSFSIDATGKKAYVVSGGNLYSIDI